MSTARKTKSQTAKPSLSERVKVARASATRLSPRSGQVEAAPDPILAAIERHRTARQAFRASVSRADDAWDAQSGSDPAAEAAWEAADLAQIEAWNALFDTQPTTSAGLVALLRHASEHAENMLDTGGTYTAASIFDVMADRVAALSAQLHGSRHCQASIIAARLGSLSAEWFEADAEGGASNSSKMALHERIQTLSEAISYTRAACPAGMMGQLAVAYDAVDTVLNGRADLREDGARRAERCLLSIAAALSALSGIDREGYGASYMMSGRLDWLACLSPKAA
ncbi:hypothetical protein LPLAFNJD_LOCUS2358 [Methylorubrum aminovorans]